jgi:hypothetical protein
MVPTQRKIHLYAGWLFVLTFVLTGQYMRYAIHPRMEMDPVLRFSLRANHVYILLFGLLHLCLGAYWRASLGARRRRLQSAGSLALLLATLIVITAFFVEPKVGEARPMLVSAMVTAVIGTGLQLLSVRGQRQ